MKQVGRERNASATRNYYVIGHAYNYSRIRSLLFINLLIKLSHSWFRVVPGVSMSC